MKKLMSFVLALVLCFSLTASFAEETVEASAQGYGGAVTVQVTFADGVITAVTVDAPNETAGIGSKAADELPAKIVAAGNADVDGVSGATITSDAIKTAVRAAIKAHNGEEAAPVALTAGVYTATVKAHNGDMTVEVTVDETAITNVAVTAHGETFGIGYGSFYCPIDKLPAQIVEHQTVSVDTITGATVTSAAIKSAVRDCLTQAGAAEDAFAAVAPSTFAVDAEYTADVVVVGGGAAGLTAANTALDAGKTVLLVEKMGITGGSTVTSGGNIFGAATTAQKASGVTDDTPEALYDFLMSFDEDNLLNADMVKDYAFGIADDLDYLDANGVDVTFITTAAAPLTPNRLHLTSEVNAITNGIGGGITVPLTEKIAAKGGQILLATKAETLLTDESGRVIGLQATGYNGETVKINAGAVILTTGGYCMNPELTARFAYFNPFFSAAKSCTGDGLLMAQAIGAKVFESDGLQLQYVDFNTGETGSTSFGLVVDIRGQRLVNEYSYQSHNAEPFKRAGSYANYYITATKDGVCAEPYGTVQYGITVPTVAKAATIEELATLINVDPASLKATVDRYNELCQKGVDEDFGKPAEYLIPVEGDMYYAFARYPVSSATFGGLVIDGCGRVQNANGETIPGLYAAGEVALTGQLAKVYPSCGLAIGNSVHMGRNAAEAACTD